MIPRLLASHTFQTPGPRPWRGSRESLTHIKEGTWVTRNHVRSRDVVP